MSLGNLLVSDGGYSSIYISASAVRSFDQGHSALFTNSLAGHDNVGDVADLGVGQDGAQSAGRAWQGVAQEEQQQLPWKLTEQLPLINHVEQSGSLQVPFLGTLKVSARTDTD